MMIERGDLKINSRGSLEITNIPMNNLSLLSEYALVHVLPRYVHLKIHFVGKKVKYESIPLNPNALT